MPTPLVIVHGGIKVLLHEKGCECERDHAYHDDFGDGKKAILSTYDDDAERGYYQVWYRTGSWGLRDALDRLLSRDRHKDRIS